jgi:crotonobetainyl-CoA:carnitine CoA-transferase CaiB-like acyl-CoA transferase
LSRVEPVRHYPTADGWVATACDRRYWLDFVTLVGDADLATDDLRCGPREPRARSRRCARPADADQSREGVIDLLSSKGIPCAPVRELGEAVD